MDINVRVSTGSPISLNSMGMDPILSSPTSVTAGQPQENLNGNSMATATASASATANSSQENISTKPVTTQTVATPTNGVNNNTNNVNVSVTNGSGNKPDQWVENLISSLKSIFESFTSSMTKVLETWLGTQKQAATTPSSTAPSAGTTSSNTSNIPSNRQIESFSQRTAKNLGDSLKGNVNEQQMQEAVVMYQLYQKDEAAEGIFKSKLAEAKAQGKVGETAVKAALIETEKAGKIERWESDWVFSLSYRASQFDTNLNELGTSSSSSLKADIALQTAERNLVSIATGAEKPVSRTVA